MQMVSKIGCFLGLLIEHHTVVKYCLLDPHTGLHDSQGRIARSIGLRINMSRSKRVTRAMETNPSVNVQLFPRCAT